MKQKYKIEVANIQLNILSDEKEDFIKEVVSKLDTEIRQITVANKRVSTTDAAILCALDYYSDKLKADRKLKNLEAQLSLYDTNLRRLKNENNALQAALGGKKAPEIKEAPAEKKPKAEEPEKAPEAKEEAPEVKEEPKANADRAASKLHQLEMLLQDMKKEDR
ncbi:MAG: cell division protein ZapA [Clostridia bacterium]|nr:cell division protein ZapA [Clostridia bacterium]